MLNPSSFGAAPLQKVTTAVCFLGIFFVWAALTTKKLCKSGTRYPGMFYSILGDRVIRSGYMIDPIQIIKWKIINIKHQQQTLGTQFCWNHVIERFVFGCCHCCHNSAVTILLWKGGCFASPTATTGFNPREHVAGWDLFLDDQGYIVLRIVQIKVWKCF